MDRLRAETFLYSSRPIESGDKNSPFIVERDLEIQVKARIEQGGRSEHD